MLKERVHVLVREALELNEELFLVSQTISESQHITVVIDGDNAVPLSECIRVSRHIENSLDEDELIYSLEVTTPDVTKPLLHQRQYQKNIGRTFQVKVEGDSYEGTLQEVTPSDIELYWKERVPKTIGKGKMTVEKKQKIAFTDIVEAKVKIIF